MARIGKKTISRRTVEALKVEKDTIFWDSELAGFGVRVHPTGRKVYIAQTRADGKAAKRVTVGRHGVITPDEARRRAALIVARIKAGEDPIPEPMAVKMAEGPAVGELAGRYLEKHVAVRCKPKTESMYRLIVAKYILPELGRRPALAVDHKEVTELHHRLSAKPVMANQVVDTLSRIYNAAEDRGDIPEASNPCRLVVKNRERRRERFLTDEEFRRLGRVLDEAETRKGVLGARGGGDPAVAADRLPQGRDPEPALERGGPGGGRVAVTRHEDGPPDDFSVAGGCGGPVADSPASRQSVRDPGEDRGQGDAEPQRPLGHRLRARRAGGHAAS